MCYIVSGPGFRPGVWLGTVPVYAAGIVQHDALSFAPPPEANPEIAINSIYWLAGQEKWIAAGPVIVPPIKVPHGRLLPIQIMVIGAWPLLQILGRRPRVPTSSSPACPWRSSSNRP